MKKLRLLAVAALVCVSACGQKGPLVLPDARTGTPVVTPAPVPAPPPNGSIVDGPAASPSATPPPADSASKDKKKPD